MPQQESGKTLTLTDITQWDLEVDKYGNIAVRDADRNIIAFIGEVFGWLGLDEGKRVKTEDYARLIANAPAMFRTLKAVVSPDDFIATKTIVELLNRIEGKESE